MKKISKKILIPVIAALCAAVVTLTILIKLSPHKLSELEQVSFSEKTQDIVYFLDVFDKEDVIPEDIKAEMSEEELAEALKQEASYDAVSFVMSLNYADGSEELKTEAVLERIRTHLDLDIDADYLRDEKFVHGLSGRYVQYDREKDSFIFNNPNDVKKVVAQTPITVYLLKSVKVKGKEYFAIYDKYIIDGPYTALNRTSQDDIPHKHSINDYLEGHGTPMAIKEVITPENIVDIESEHSEVEVVYELKDGNILLKEVKK